MKDPCFICYTVKLTSMKENPSEGSTSIASQEIHNVLYSPKVQYCVLYSLPLFHTLSQINSTHALPSHFCKIQFSIILPSMPRSYKWSLFLRFPKLNLVHISLPHMSHPCSFHPSLFDNQNHICSEYTSQSSSSCSFLQSLATSSLLDPSIFLSTILPNTYHQPIFYYLMLQNIFQIHIQQQEKLHLLCTQHPQGCLEEHNQTATSFQIKNECLVIRLKLPPEVSLTSPHVTWTTQTTLLPNITIIC